MRYFHVCVLKGIWFFQVSGKQIWDFYYFHVSVNQGQESLFFSQNTPKITYKIFMQMV